MKKDNELDRSKLFIIRRHSKELFVVLFCQIMSEARSKINDRTCNGHRRLLEQHQDEQAGYEGLLAVNKSKMSSCYKVEQIRTVFHFLRGDQIGN